MSNVARVQPNKRSEVYKGTKIEYSFDTVTKTWVYRYVVTRKLPIRGNASTYTRAQKQAHKQIDEEAK